MALEQHPRWVILKLDLANAFNEMSRATVLHAVENGFEGEFWDLSPLFRTSLTLKSIIILGNHAKSRADFDSEEGMQQGSGEVPAGFCLGVHADLVTINLHPTAAALDDTYLLGPIERMLPTAVLFAARLEEGTGIHLNVDKNVIHSFEPARSAQFITDNPEYVGRFRVGCLDAVDPRLHPNGDGYGAMACGIPIGEESFVRNHVDGKVDTALEQVLETLEKLRCVHHQSAWVQTFFCIRPKL